MKTNTIANPLHRTHLNLLIAEGENRSRRQQPDDGARQHQDSSSHGPVEGGHTRRGIEAGIAPLGTGQTLVGR